MRITNKKLLAQGVGSAATPLDLYSCPANTVVALYSLVVCNRGAADAIRVSVSLLGAATATKDYLYYDMALEVADTFAASLDFVLPASSIMRVYSTTGNSSFTLFGEEIYPI